MVKFCCTLQAVSGHFIIVAAMIVSGTDMSFVMVQNSTFGNGLKGLIK